VYYYHQVTRVSRWTPPPVDAIGDAVADRIQKTQSQVEETTQKRLQELEEARRQQENKEARAQALREDIARAVNTWKSNGRGREKDIGELLSTLHMIISTIAVGSITANQLTASSEPSEVCNK
jgi:hypothetical protein